MTEFASMGDTGFEHNAKNPRNTNRCESRRCRIRCGFSLWPAIAAAGAHGNYRRVVPTARGCARASERHR
jgi:hypothetical protein